MIMGAMFVVGSLVGAVCFKAAEAHKSIRLFGLGVLVWFSLDRDWET